MIRFRCYLSIIFNFLSTIIKIIQVIKERVSKGSHGQARMMCRFVLQYN